MCNKTLDFSNNEPEIKKLFKSLYYYILHVVRISNNNKLFTIKTFARWRIFGPFRFVKPKFLCITIRIRNLLSVATHLAAVPLIAYDIGCPNG
jgi:hypothetical protein